MYGDEEMMRFITGRARTPWETRARLKKDLRLHREFGFGLCLGLSRANGAVVGRYGLEPRPEDDGLSGELAWMTKPEFRGLGYAVEAGAALIEQGAELGLATIYAHTRPENRASIRVMQRLGLALESETENNLRFSVPDPTLPHPPSSEET